MKTETLGFVTQEIAPELAGEVRKWRGRIQNTGTVAEQQYYKLVGTAANRSPADVEYVLKCASETRRQLLRQGYYVTIGNVSYYPVLGGGFDKPDAAFNPKVNKLEVVAVPRSALKKCLSGVTPVNLVETPMPVIQAAMDKETGKEGEVIVGHTVYVAGRNLALDSTRSDETAWLETLAGEKVADGTVTASIRKAVDNIIISCLPTWHGSRRELHQSP